MATTPGGLNPQQATAQLFAMLKSVAEFDEAELRGVLKTVLASTDRENCFLAIYHRAVANVASLRALTTRQHFQAVSMLTRTLFELAVDIRLINVVTDAIPKMLFLSEVEKLRCAKKILGFKSNHPNAKVDDSVYGSFVAAGREKDRNKEEFAVARPKADRTLVSNEPRGTSGKARRAI